jgi:LysM repeat protein
LTDDRDLSGTNEISNYVVKEGESLSSVAKKFKVSKETIIWANNFKDNVVLNP